MHLSHLVLNSNLYPQLLLGFNQNNEISDSLSCTSNYSIYTNEGSSVSGLNPNQQFHHNEMFSNLQNSNHRNNYQNTSINNSSTYNSVNNNNTVFSNNNNTVNPNSKNQSTNNVIIQNNNLINNQDGQNRLAQQSLNLLNDCFPKINLQVDFILKKIPAMLSPGEVSMINGYNPYGEQNIDIYVHTLVTPTTILRQNNTALENLNLNNTTTNTNHNISYNSQEINNTSTNNQQNQANSQRYNRSNTRTNDISIQTGLNDETRQNNINSSSFNRNQLNNNNQNTNNFNNNPNNFENIMSIISNSKLILKLDQSHNRRSSMGSETSRDSQSNIQPQNINRHINIINNRNITTNSININTNNNNPLNTISNHISTGLNQINNLKENSCQTEITVNSNVNINNNKVNYNESLIDSISNKSEKNIENKRFCGKSQKSVKSVSDLSDFEHYNEDEQNDFQAKNKNVKFNNNIINNINQNDSRNLSINTLSKLNESFHSASVKSLMSKNENEYEEKDDEKN